MYSLEEKISRWREKLIVSQDLQEEVADELEDHLRQKLDELNDSGLSDEDKFILAQTRLGHSSRIGNEFEKLNEHSQRLRRVGYMIGGYLLIDTAIKVVHVAAQILSGISLSRSGTVVSPSTILPSTIYIVTASVLLLALFYCLWSAIKTESPQQGKRFIQKFIAAQYQNPRYTIAAALFGLIVITLMKRVVLPMIMAMYVSSRQYGEFMMHTAIYEMSITVLIPLVLLALLLWVIRTNRTMQRQIK